MMKKTVLLVVVLVVSTTFRPLFSQTQVGASIQGQGAGDHLGTSVSLSSNGTRVATGAGGNEIDEGYVNIYERVAEDWVQLGNTIWLGNCNGTDTELETLLEALRSDLTGTLQSQSEADGWPARVCNGYLFVSADSQLTMLAGDHNGWVPAAMISDIGFHWAVVDVPDGSQYKFTDGGIWLADPWSRSYIHDNYGRMSLVHPISAHLDQFFNVTDGDVMPRIVRIWVPATVPTHVMYMHDGQNLFDPDAFWGGWKINESVPSDMMIVGIDNTINRIEEYTHCTDDIGSIVGGAGDSYADFVQGTVRKLVRNHYGEPGVVGVMGSSLGGLSSCYIALRYPDEYDFAGSMSGTMGWGSIGLTGGLQNETIIEIYEAAGLQNFALYLDSGGNGPCSDSDGDGIEDDGSGSDNYCENAQFGQVLLMGGYTAGVDYWYYWDVDAMHNEAAWANRVNIPFGYFASLTNTVASVLPIDQHSTSVSLSSDGVRIAIGEIGNANSAGRTTVYELSGTNWVQLGTDIGGEAIGDQSGISVSLSSDGTRVAIGAPRNNGGAGHVRVYELVSNVWTQLGYNIDGETVGDQSGISVSLSSDGLRLAIGADGNNEGTGHVRVYELIVGVWTQVGADIDGEAVGDRSGISVSLSPDGNGVAIGAVGNNGDIGHVRVFEFEVNNWVQVGSDIDGETVGDWFGISVALSSDGTKLGIGADGINGGTGRVQVYEFLDSAWTQTGADLEGDAAGDRAGISVSLSGNGSVVAFGADGNLDNEGQIRVYEFESVGVESVYEIDVVSICPNPTSGKIQILGIEYKTIDLIDNLGRSIWSIEQPASEIDISGVAPGMYSLLIRSDDQLIVRKIVKE